MAIPFTNVVGSVVASGTEYSLPSAANYSSGSPQTAPIKLQLAIDARSMLAGDTIQLSIYDKANGGTQALVWQGNLVGTQSRLLTLPERWLKEGWDVTIKLIAGAGSTVAWSLKEDVGDRQLGAGAITAATFAADSITASALATDAVVEIAAAVSAAVAAPSAASIATAVLAATIHTGYSVARALRIIGGAVAGKMSGVSTDTPVVRFLDDSGNAITGTTTADGRTTAVHGA
jgi:hypothetical protein